MVATDSDHAWAQFLIEEGVLDGPEYTTRNEWFYERYKDGTLDIAQFLEFQLAPIANRPRAQLDAWHREFMQRKIRGMILPAAPALIAKHAKDTTAIVTATNRFITAPIAAELGIPNLLATKIKRVDEWLAAQGRRLSDYAESWFYSDSLNDLPLLERVTNPVAVDPDPTLRAHAVKRGWPVMSLRP